MSEGGVTIPVPGFAVGGAISDLLLGKRRERPWESRHGIGKILGRASVANWQSLTADQRRDLERTAKAAFLDALARSIPPYAIGTREGVARGIGSFPDVRKHLKALRSKVPTMPRGRVLANVEPGSAQVVEGETYPSATGRKAGGGKRMAGVTDVVSDILGAAQSLYGMYSGAQVAKAKAKAAKALAGGAGVYMPYPSSIPSAAVMPTSALQAGYVPTGTPVQAGMINGSGGILQRALGALPEVIGPGAAGFGAGIAAGYGASALAQHFAGPGGGGGGTVMLHPGDSIDSLYAARTVTRPPSLFATQDADGRVRWFRTAGRPILFSGDLAACRRVRRAASMAHRFLGSGGRARGRVYFRRRRR